MGTATVEIEFALYKKYTVAFPKKILLMQD
jgi:hypothetical protein